MITLDEAYLLCTYLNSVVILFMKAHHLFNIIFRLARHEQAIQFCFSWIETKFADCLGWFLEMGILAPSKIFTISCEGQIAF